jgi:arylsulfatase A-like enzyme
VLIIADDRGCRGLGCYGRERVRTLHVDALAREGLQLADFYAGIMTRLNRNVGRLITSGTELGIAEDTVVLCTSDNVPINAWGADLDFFHNAGPLSQWKPLADWAAARLRPRSAIRFFLPERSLPRGFS